MSIEIYDPAELEAIAAAADLAATAQAAACEALRRGLDVQDVDARTAELIRQSGGSPAFAGYGGFPSQAIVVCVDEEVTNAVTRPRTLRPGEIASVSVAVARGRMHAKAETAFVIGEPASRVKALLEATTTALERGVDAARMGNRIGDISFAIGDSARSSGFDVVEAYCGHGIGRALHADPQVPCKGRAHMGLRLREGMVLYVMAMLVAGDASLEVLEDGWTAATADGSPSATAAAMVAITPDGPQRLGSPSAAELPTVPGGPQRGWFGRMLDRFR